MTPFIVDEYAMIAILFVLNIYILAGAIIRVKKLNFMHESSVAIIFGALVAFVLLKIFG